MCQIDVLGKQTKKTLDKPDQIHDLHAFPRICRDVSFFFFFAWFHWFHLIADKYFVDLTLEKRLQRMYWEIGREGKI